MRCGRGKYVVFLLDISGILIHHNSPLRDHHIDDLDSARQTLSDGRVVRSAEQQGRGLKSLPVRLISVPPENSTRRLVA